MTPATAIAIEPTAIDPKSDRVYARCPVANDEWQCARYEGHKNEHRETLSKPLDPEKQARREVYLAATDTPEKKKAYFAAKASRAAAKKASQKKPPRTGPAGVTKPRAASASASKARKPAARQPRSKAASR